MARRVRAWMMLGGRSRQVELCSTSPPLPGPSRTSLPEPSNLIGAATWPRSSTRPRPVAVAAREAAPLPPHLLPPQFIQKRRTNSSFATLLLAGSPQGLSAHNTDEPTPIDRKAPPRPAGAVLYSRAGDRGPRIVRSVYSLDVALGALARPGQWAELFRRLGDQFLEHGEDLQGPLGPLAGVCRRSWHQPASNDCL